jgi:uncharacterized membrane protein (UPF0127 family)
MRTLRNLRTGAILALRVRVADTPGARELGLLSHDVVPSDDGLWLDDTAEVSTFGMRSPIDVVFLDATGGVLATYRNIPPNRTIRCANARSAIQLGAARDRDLRHGDVLALD